MGATTLNETNFGTNFGLTTSERTVARTHNSKIKRNVFIIDNQFRNSD